MIDCPFRTTLGTCRHVDTACGRPVTSFSDAAGRVFTFDEDSCLYCIKTHPDPATRHLSKPVANWIANGKGAKDRPKCKHLGAFVRSNEDAKKRHCGMCAYHECEKDQGDDGIVRPDLHCASCTLYEPTVSATPVAAPPPQAPPAPPNRAEGVVTTATEKGDTLTVSRDLGGVQVVTTKPLRKLILRHDCPPGDIVCMTAAVRDLHKAYPRKFLTDVRTPQAQSLWDHNPRIARIDDRDPEAVHLTLDFGPAVSRCQQTGRHTIDGFIDSLSGLLKVPIPKTRVTGELFLSAEERRPSDFPGPYWLIVSGGKNDFTVKHPVPEHLQAVVDHFAGQIRFLQVGAAKDHHPRLSGAVDLVGRTTLRDLVRLVHHADGVVTPITALMHLAAAVPRPTGEALSRPCVVLAGGREPRTWYGYPTHRILDSVGTLDCCRAKSCWKGRTVALSPNDDPGGLCVMPRDGYPECQRRILPADVIRAVESYL